jgi:hypothetical protein
MMGIAGMGFSRCCQHTVEPIVRKAHDFFSVMIGLKRICRASSSKILSPDVIEIDMPANADPSINRTFRGIAIDSSDEFEHADDPIRVHLESDQVSERSSYSEQLDDDTEKVKKHLPTMSLIYRILQRDDHRTLA